MTPLRLIQAILATLDRPERWSQRALARNQHGVVLLYPEDPAAVQFCIAGAAMRAFTNVGLELDLTTFEVTMDLIAEQTDYGNVARFNDDPCTTYEDVCLALKHALVLLEEEATWEG